MGIYIVKQYEDFIVFRFGKIKRIKSGGGLFVTNPITDTAHTIDRRTVTIDVPNQEIITKDNVSVAVDAVVYYNVFSSELAITSVSNYKYSTEMMAQSTLRDIIGRMTLDELLSKRAELNDRLQESLDNSTKPWGIKVTDVTIKNVTLPQSLQRAIAKEAEAEREKRSRVILAEGEKESALKMKEAADLYGQNAISVRLRELQTLAEIAREKNMIVVTDMHDAGNVIATAKAVR